MLCIAALSVILHSKYGSRQLFSDLFGASVPPGSRALLSWAWWFVSQGLMGFVLPVAILVGLFKKNPAEIGLGLGDWRFALTLAVAYVPLVLIGTWILSDLPSFQRSYPHLSNATTSWNVFLAWEFLFLFYWIGWEYLWRGFVLFGTAPAFGVNAIFVQAMPFAMLHLNKPLPEAILSIVGGVALGALVWRCRSFWIAVPIHAFQMLALDFFCTMRSRTGAGGIGIDALRQLFGG